MATNPNRRNARGVWKLKDIQSFKQDGEYPNGAAIGIFAGGGAPASNVIDFIQTASTGNAVDFGDLVATTVGASTTSNATRCLISGGYEPSVQWSDRIQYITPSTKGNTQDFGNLTTGCGYPAGMSNNTRVIQSNGHEGAGGSTSLNSEMDTMLFASLGNSTDFGDLTSPAKYGEAAASNSVRGIVAGGRDPDASPIYINDIDMFNFASTGSASDFGDLLTATHYFSGCSDGITAMFINGSASDSNSRTQAVQIMTTGNATDFNDTTINSNGAAMAGGNRGINAGGRTSNPAPSVNNIEFFDIKSRADAVDFGDLTNVNALQTNSGSPTRGITAGGVHNPGSVTNLNIIDFITFATNGNATDFGDLTAIQRSQSSFSSKTRMCIAGGQAPGTTKIEKIEIATTGNAVDFADAISGTTENGRGTSNNIKGVYQRGGVVNTVHQLNINAGGTATDFGDLTVARTASHAASDGHGGLETGVVQRPSVTYMPGSGRAIIMPTGDSNEILEMFNVNTKGNTSTFGNLATDKGSRHGGTCSSNTRYIYSGGRSNTAIESVEFATEGNAADFGDLHSDVGYSAGVSSITRGIFQGGNDVPADLNVIEYITIATAGNASDFGDLTVARQYAGGVCSPTRGVCGGGNPRVNVIDYITIASTGDSTDFGDLSATRDALASAGSSVRGLFGGGTEPTKVNTIEYITIASTGNVTDFGDLNNAVEGPTGSGNNTRGVFAGGRTPTALNVMDFVTIASTGNASDFGDISSARYYLSSSVNSDSHGGLQG